MKPTIEVDPAVMRWARESIGLSVEEAARKLRLSANTVEAWESGSKQPTVGQFRRAANVYKRPTFVLKLRTPPTDFQPMRDFRRVETGPMPYWLNVAILRAQEQLDMIHDMAEYAPPVERPLALVREHDVRTAAAAIRDALGVSVAQQRKWPNPGAALAEWKRIVEPLGVFVIQFQDVDVRVARGFARRGETYSVVALNSQDSPRGRIFTLFHELAHLGLSDTGVCDLDARSRFPIERFCNKVAGEALMPESDVRLQLLGLREKSDNSLLERLREVGARFHTSTEATLIRAIELGELDESAWERLAPRLQELYKAAAERRGARSGSGSFYRNQVSRYGRTYVETVADAYSFDRLSLGDVCDILGLKVHQVPKLIGAL